MAAAVAAAWVAWAVWTCNNPQRVIWFERERASARSFFCVAAAEVAGEVGYLRFELLEG
jgi:hypothetical protein